MGVEKNLIYGDETYKIIGACFSVYNEMGHGFLEAVYQECLGIEFELQDIPANGQVDLRLKYKDRALEKRYEADFICYGKIVLELKSVDELRDQHRAQLLNYLNATDMRLGLLVNFGRHPKLQWERLVV